MGRQVRQPRLRIRASRPLTGPARARSLDAVAVQRFSHLGICVSDLERSLRFYRDLLGFGERGRLEVQGDTCDTLLALEGVKLEAVFLERDGLRIELLHYLSPCIAGDSSPRPMNQRGLTHLSLRVDDLDATLATFEREGARVLRDTKIDLVGGRTAAAFVCDPDGTRLELVQAPGDPSRLPSG